MKQQNLLRNMKKSGSSYIPGRKRQVAEKQHGKEGRNLSAFTFVIHIHLSIATNSSSIHLLPFNLSTHALGNVLLLRTLQKTLPLNMS